MRDKDLVALITLISFLLYFVPSTPVKFITLAFILFFSPGFFVLKMYRDSSREELLLISPPVSLVLSGLIALFLAALSILRAETMLISMALFIGIFYFLVRGEELELKVKFHGLEKLATVIIILSIVIGASWLYAGFSQKSYREADIAIQEWPHNATVNSTLRFVIYVKNWDFQNSRFSVIFKLNNESIEMKNFTLSKGDELTLTFLAKSDKLGKNLASFDLYINDEFYTNVHVYFILNPQS